jgi:hypothetical protein
MLTAMRCASSRVIRCAASSRLVLEIDVGERVAVGVVHDVAGLPQLRVWIIDGPRRGEAAGFSHEGSGAASCWIDCRATGADGTRPRRLRRSLCARCNDASVVVIRPLP